MAGNVTAVKLRRFIDSAPEIPTGILHHQGKDVCGYYTGQLARLYVAYPPEGQPKLFTKLQPIPVKHEIEPHHEYDHHILKQYIHYQRKMKKVHDWHTQTTYREAFTLPIFKSGSADDGYRPRTEAESLSVWKSVSVKRRGGKPSFMGV
ncbi:protein SPMIP3 [Anolis carolinensis]|uniref:protein SPMIP3 n=1 Tax=Anolis carolinensis TaxID=28377 RepID=UPI002F2B59F6